MAFREADSIELPPIGPKAASPPVMEFGERHSLLDADPEPGDSLMSEER